MPGKVKVRILAGRNLPVMDRSSDTSDAYVEVKLGNTTFKTDVCKKSLNPQWNSEWFKFEVDDEELQDEPLQIRIMDYDTYSANDAIGKVYIDLSPLLFSRTSGSVMSGWIPIFDTMHGIRGEVNVIVKVDLFSDFNRFRQSSCGVQFFCTPSIPFGYWAHAIHGFVEELVVNDDPEYQWIDKIRTPRASNEARQTLFSKLSGEVQRKIGLKALELGGNAVVGYCQCFDLEGDSGIVVRGIGTAVTLVRYSSETSQQTPSPSKEGSRESISLDSIVNTNTLNSETHHPTPQLRFHPTLPTPLYTPSSRSVCKLAAALSCPPVVDGRSASFSGASSSFCRSSRHRLQSAILPARPFLSLLASACNLSRFRPRSQSTGGGTTILQDERQAAAIKIQQYLSQQFETSLDSHNPKLPHQYHCLAQYPHGEDDLHSPPSSSKASTPSPEISIAIPSLNTLYCGPNSAPTSPQRANTDFTCCLSDSSFPCSGDLERTTPSQGIPLSKSPLYRRSPLPEEGFPINPGSPVSHTPNKLSQSPIKPSIPCVCRRSSDSDLNITPKSSNCGGSGTCIGGSRSARQTLPQESLEMLEYPFLSMTHFPPGFIIHIGGVVSTHSVKLLGRIHNPDEPETRDTWWTEIRMEIRSHARALGCNVVLGYRESTSICDDICVLSASGTAAIVCMAHSEADSGRKEFNLTTTERKEPEREKEKDRSIRSDSIIMSSLDKKRHASDGPVSARKHHIIKNDDACSQVCSVCHIPYSESSIPFPITLTKCSICKKSKVPDVLFTTIELPPGVPVTGSACLIQARVCRMKKDAKGEVNAKEISDSLPFLEYELHRQLINKLKVKGMNALFGLKVQVSVGAKILVAVATATAMFLTPLPPPQVPKISSGKSFEEEKLAEIQRLIQDCIEKNRDAYDLKHTIPQNTLQDPELLFAAKDSDCSDDDLPELDLSSGNKDTCVLEIDDADDVDIITLLMDPSPPEGFEIVNTEIVPGVDNLVCNLQMFSRVWRCKLQQGNLSCRQLSQIFENIIQSLFFKLRKMIPCVLCSVQFLVELPEDEELQVTVLGMVAGVGDFHSSTSKTLITSKPSAFKSVSSLPDQDSELIFNMEEDHPELFSSHSGSKLTSKSKRFISVEKKFNYHKLMKERFGIELSPLSYIPGGRIERYLGNLNFFFIRECTSIRENGGLSGFVQSFLAEVLAIVRSHVAALGGNAMISFFMNQCVLLHNPHKNQGQCLINIGGDVVQVLYPLELMAPQQTTVASLICTSPVTVPTVSHSDPNAARKVLSRSPKEPKSSSFVMGSQGSLDPRALSLRRGLRKKRPIRLGYMTP